MSTARSGIGLVWLDAGDVIDEQGKRARYVGAELVATAWCNANGVLHPRWPQIMAKLREVFDVIGKGRVAYEARPLRWYDFPMETIEGRWYADAELTAAIVRHLLTLDTAFIVESSIFARQFNDPNGRSFRLTTNNADAVVGCKVTTTA